MKRIWLSCLVMLFASIAYGSDVEQEQSVLYPYKSQMVWQEDFLSGTVAGVQGLGKLGIGVTNGNTVQQASETNRPGILRRGTTAVVNTVTTTYLYSMDGLIEGSTFHDITWMVRLNNNDASTIQRIGSANSALGVDPPDNGIYIEKAAADTNWFCITRSATVQTRTDTGIAVNTNFNTFRYQRVNGAVLFWINNTSVCGSHTANIPTTFLNPWTLIENVVGGVSKTMDMDYMQLRITSLTR